jgi:hypothetical protein
MTLPSDEQKQRAKWDLLLTDLEYRQQQLRISKWETPKAIAMIALAVAALMAAGRLADLWIPVRQQQIIVQFGQPLEVKVVPP